MALVIELSTDCVVSTRYEKVVSVAPPRPIESIGTPFGSVVIKLIAQTCCAAVVGCTTGLSVEDGAGVPPGFTPNSSDRSKLIVNSPPPVGFPPLLGT